MDQQSTNHLLALLRSNSGVIDRPFVNNLVYYTPRIRSLPQLTSLVNAIFTSRSLSQFEIKELFNMAQAIIYWKLEISEPSISVSSFYSIWGSCFKNCKSWSLPKLSILGGILSTKYKFYDLQKSTFIDDTGEISTYYKRWKELYFLPIMNQTLLKHHADTDSLILIYSTISEQEDTEHNKIYNWNLISGVLSKVFSSYMLFPEERNEFLSSNINKVAKTLKISVACSSELFISRFLSALCRDCYNLSAMEWKSNPSKDYSDRRYYSILLTITLTLQGILEGPKTLPTSWYYQCVMCLFYTSFISQDIGVVGLDSYETVHEITCTALVNSQDKMSCNEILNTMKRNTWHSSVPGNKINRARLLFMLNFMSTILNQVKNINIDFISDAIVPIEQIYINSPDKEIRESAHLVIISLFMNSICSELTSWQLQNYLGYLNLSSSQFLKDEISESQILIVFEKLSSRYPYLSQINKHLLRDALHQIYLIIINCRKCDTEKKKTLLQCLIRQIPYLSGKHVTAWLDTCQELLQSSNFTLYQQSKISSDLWNVISNFRSDTALKWWYSHMIPSNAKL